ncbi:MAG: sulfotransferase domain-containing protein [Pseudomonadota bacterium]
MARRQLYLGPLTDNRRWGHVALRRGDSIVVTPPKSGTTWMQTIIALLLSGDPEIETELSIKMPWVDFRLREMPEVAQRLNAMTGARSMKSHTPLDGLPIHDAAQYICVFRHPLDVHVSYRGHLKNIPLPWFDHWYPERDPEGIAFQRFLDGGAEGFDGDAVTLAHIIRHYQSAIERAHAPNIWLFHYADMLDDLAGTFARVASILGVSYPADRMESLIAMARFDNMKAHAARFAPSGGKGFMKSDADFFRTGKSGNWAGTLSKTERAAYDGAMDKMLSPAERAWLEFGAAGSAPD